MKLQSKHRNGTICGCVIMTTSSDFRTWLTDNSYSKFRDSMRSRPSVPDSMRKKQPPTYIFLYKVNEREGNYSTMLLKINMDMGNDVWLHGGFNSFRSYVVDQRSYGTFERNLLKYPYMILGGFNPSKNSIANTSDIEALLDCLRDACNGKQSRYTIDELIDLSDHTADDIEFMFNSAGHRATLSEKKILEFLTMCHVSMDSNVGTQIQTVSRRTRQF